MTPLEQLQKLDQQLLRVLANPQELDENGVAEQLATRARLLQQVIELGDVSKSESTELIKRSHQLKEAAEEAQRKLGEKLKTMQKGRRSVRAYQTVKRS